MRFLTIENWFDHNGVFHAASQEAPHTFDYPDDMVPNVRWFPLDKRAEAALKRIADSNPNVRVRGLFAVEDDGKAIEVIEPPVLRAEILPKAAPKGVPTPALSEMQKGMRPSDKEP